MRHADDSPGTGERAGGGLQGTSFDDVTGSERNRFRDLGVTSFPDLCALALNRQVERDLRERACWFLGLSADKRYLPALCTLLDDDQVAVSAIDALGRLGGKRAVKPLLDLLMRPSDSEVREAAAHALGFIGDSRAGAPLLRVLEDPDEAVALRAQAAESLAYLGYRQAVPALIAGLNDPAPAIRFWCAFALGHLGSREIIPYLAPLAESDDALVPGRWTVKQEAALAMAWLRGEDPDWPERQA